MESTTLNGTNRFSNVTALGHGAFGSVVKANDGNHGGRLVAVKAAQLPQDPKARKRLEREVKLLLALKHPGIVTLHESFEGHRTICFVMEYLQGPTLDSLLDKSGALSELAAASLARQLLAALTHIHAQGIVHRDIKPDNIMAAERRGSPRTIANMHWKIVDFGFGRKLPSRLRRPSTRQRAPRCRVSCGALMLRACTQARRDHRSYALLNYVCYVRAQVARPRPLLQWRANHRLHQRLNPWHHVTGLRSDSGRDVGVVAFGDDRRYYYERWPDGRHGPACRDLRDLRETYGWCVPFRALLWGMVARLPL